MHHFIFPTKDTWISSGSSTIDGESFKDQNFGRDQILEVKKFFYNNQFDHQTRALINFEGTDFTEMSKSVADGTISSPKFYLRLYEAEGNSELSEEYKLLVQPISESWVEGTGKLGDRPKNTNGCSWENKSNPIGSNEVTWSSTVAVGATFASGTITIPTDRFANKEITIGGHNFVFVSGSASNFDNNSNQTFLQSGSHVNITANNLTASINSATSTHNLKITASRGGTGVVILSGSEAGTVANYTVTNLNGFLSVMGGGSDTTDWTAGANGPSVVSVSHSVQSFSNESPDVNVEVTDMVNGWLDGTIDNYGMVLRFSGSQETDSETFGHLKFFSRNTHTIYSPRLEVRWEDSSFDSNVTASLNELTMSGLADNYLYMRGLRESYKENDRVKFRVGARKRYIQKTFSNSVQTVTGSYFPSNSGSYAIKDVATGEYIVPFSSHTSMSLDAEGMYFNQWLDGFYPDRTYKILLKLNYNDGQEQIFDDDFEFIIKRS